MTESQEFITLQKELLKHKFLYYVKHEPILSDYDYDMLELSSYKLAKTLGFRANRFDDPDENEKHHVHWMVGYNENSIYNI